MKKKLLGSALALIFLIALSVPLVLAKPGAEKSNEKFEYFELLVSGAPDTTSGIVKETFLDEMVKTRHVSGRGWLPGTVVELAVGGETFTMTSEPYSVDYTTTFDAIAIFNNDGTSKLSLVKLVDVVTLYDEGDEIGTLVLNLEAAIDFSTTPPGYGGTVRGFGTGALEGVHVSGLDIGLITAPGPDGQYLRIGTITGWPENIMNP